MFERCHNTMTRERQQEIAVAKERIPFATCDCEITL